MKKFINVCLLVSIIPFSPVLRAQNHEPEPMKPQYAPSANGDESREVPEETQGDGAEQAPGEEPQPDSGDPSDDSTIPLTPPPPSDELTTPEVTPLDNEDEGTPVGQAANEGAKAAKRKQWQNIAFATDRRGPGHYRPRSDS